MEPALAMDQELQAPDGEPRSASGRWAIRARSGWDTSQTSHAVGDVLAGRYEILAPLGEGGMGSVWRAHCAALDIDVAIKVLHRNNADENAAARLLREARATASLRHPSIVRTFDFGTTDAGEPFLVMELLEGTSLADWLDEHGRMAAGQAVQVLLPIADALSAAHAQGIVHRDVKPGNIIVKVDGDGPSSPKLYDFGIAKVNATNVGVLTQEGAVLGSVQYMSPEQANGHPVGPQTDVWAFSVVLYELITGRRPFDAPSLVAMIYAVYNCAPPPTTDFAAGDEALWQIIARGLHKNPKERWPSMQALGRALAAWSIEQGMTVDASATSLRHHWLLGEDVPEAAVAPAPRSTPPLAMPDEPSRSGLRFVDTASLPAIEPSSVSPRLTGRSSVMVTSTPPPRPKRHWAVSAAAAVAFACALVGGTVAARRGGPTPSSPQLSIVPAQAMAAPRGETLTPPAPVPPVTVAPSAEVERRAVAASATTTPRVLAPRRPNRVAAGMPLPSTPDF